MVEADIGGAGSGLTSDVIGLSNPAHREVLA
jgi:hypothetical protein